MGNPKVADTSTEPHTAVTDRATPGLVQCSDEHGLQSNPLVSQNLPTDNDDLRARAMRIYASENAGGSAPEQGRPGAQRDSDSGPAVRTAVTLSTADQHVAAI